MKKLTNKFVIVAIVCLFVFGCASFVKTSHHTLGTIAHTAKAAMDACQDLHNNGIMSDQDYTTALNIYSRIVTTHSMAVEGLKMYQKLDESNRDGTKVTLEEALAALPVMVEELITLVNSYLGNFEVPAE